MALVFKTTHHGACSHCRAEMWSGFDNADYNNFAGRDVCISCIAWLDSPSAEQALAQSIDASQALPNPVDRDLANGIVLALRARGFVIVPAEKVGDAS